MIFERRYETKYHPWFAWWPVYLYGPDEWDRARWKNTSPRLVWLRWIERMRCKPRTYYGLHDPDVPVRAGRT